MNWDLSVFYKVMIHRLSAILPAAKRLLLKSRPF